MTIYWDEDFEGNLTDNWGVNQCFAGLGGQSSPFTNGCNPRIDSSQKHSGSNSVLCDYTGEIYDDGGAGAYGIFINRSFTATQDLWVRFYWYTISPYGYYTGNGIAKIMIFGNPNRNWDLVLVNKWDNSFSFIIEDKINGLGQTLTSNQDGSDISHDVWHLVELNINAGSKGNSDGVVRLWVDNTLRLSYTNVPIVASGNPDPTTSSFMEIGCQAAGDYALDGSDIGNTINNGKRWIDNLAVGDEQIGPIGGGGSIVKQARHHYAMMQS